MPAKAESIEVIAAQNGRWYRDGDGPWCKSVTTITGNYPFDEGFFMWLGNATSYADAMAYRDEAADSGTKLHDACVRLLLGETVRMDDWTKAEKKKLNGFRNWAIETKFKLVQAEWGFVHQGEVDYGGRVDLIGYIDDELWVIDIKTGNAVYDSHRVQVVAYAVGVECELPFDGCIDRVGLLQLKSSTKKGWQMHEVEKGATFWTEADEWMTFVALAIVSDYRQGDEPKIVEDEEEEVELSL